ncbi:thioredoxin family protein [Salinirubellus salinus]|uniref:Thioredoxin family protein n=1 Tax=Salinirubellus salinus TaxID=1364945 RepID=A0A9E7UBK7_9EURY|nr:thioredoxin family protein [Salinirubellus salinus]UWM55293.1 thioredoxin family protein [Salinirubellus salinus]
MNEERTTAQRYEFLLDCGVLVEERDDPDRLAASEAYDAERGVYHDTYGDASDEVFHGTLADLFDMSDEEAAETATELGITRAELVAFLSLRGYFKRQAPDVEVSRDELLHLATLVAGVSATSPVPEAMPEVDDEDYEAFLEANEDAVVFVWRLHCEPCDRMKDDLDAILSAVPNGVAVAGVDGESVSDFRRAFDVDAAPATLTFADGALLDAVSGRRTPEQLEELFTSAFGEAATN